jgi:hypothetical protein
MERELHLVDLFRKCVSKEAKHQYEIRRFYTGREISTGEEMIEDWKMAEKVVVKELFNGEIPNHLVEITKKMCPICFVEQEVFIACNYCHQEICVNDALKWMSFKRGPCPFCRQCFYK